MKKFILVLCFLFLMCQSAVLADEIVDAKGNIIPCRIETIGDGLVEYHKDGFINRFVRINDASVFNDYVDVRTNLLKRHSVVRYSGTIVLKDMWSTVLRTENGDIDVPFYKVKFIGVYKP